MHSRSIDKISRSIAGSLVMCAAFSSFSTVAWAQPNSLWASQDGKTDQLMVQNDQMLDLSNSDASSLRLEGEQALRFNDLGRAITVLKRAVELAPTDMSGRVLLAEALERQVDALPEKEAPVFNLTIKQWLYVAKESANANQSNEALNHLKKLTGNKPGKFESATKYLSKVLMPEEAATQQIAAKKDTVAQ